MTEWNSSRGQCLDFTPTWESKDNGSQDGGGRWD